MSREEMWKEFETQLIRETRTPITVSYDVSEKMTKSAIERTVAKWKERLEQEPKTKIEESNFSREQYALDIDTAWKCGYETGKKENSPVNICPHCGEYIGEEE